MNSTVIALILIIFTTILSIGLFALYDFYFSQTQGNLIVQGNAILVSKLLQVEVTGLAYYYNLTGNYFNASYLIWIDAPVSRLTVVPFVVHPMNLSELFYYLPSQPQNASFFTSTQNGYKAINSFSLSANVYLPQEATLLGRVNGLTAYNVSTNSTYVVSARLYSNEIIVLWVLYNYQGQWYRVGYTYIDPFSQGMGIYLLTLSGNYGGNSKTQLSYAQAPHYFTTQSGFGFGLWFQPALNYTGKALVFNLTFTATNKNNVTLLAYLSSSKLYVKTINLANGNASSTFLYSLQQGSWYFLNVSTGSQVGSSQYFLITLYSQNGKRLNFTVLPSFTELNGYNITVTFGSRVYAVLISQAYAVSLQSTSGLPYFYNVSSTMLKNGPLYNNTLIYNETINKAQNELYAIAYWYFVWFTNSPPSQIVGILWYWLQGTQKYASIYYIPEIGPNTYAVI